MRGLKRRPMRHSLPILVCVMASAALLAACSDDSADGPVDLAQVRACVEELGPYSIVDDPQEWTPLSEHARDGFWVDFPVEDEYDDWDGDGAPDGWGVSVAVMESEEDAAALFGQIQDFYDGGVSRDYAYNVGNVSFAWQGDSSTEHPDVAQELEECAGGA